jgi:mono/diheme cytochrome c family protein
MVPNTNISRSVAAAVLMAAVALPAFSEGSSQEALDFFEAKVRPVLASRCYTCHGPEKQKTGLRLDSRASMLKGGDGGPVLKEDNGAASSRILQVIAYDTRTKMPPDAKLPQEQIDAINEWVKMGAPWPEGDAALAANEATPWEERVASAKATHWAFQTVTNPDLPAVEAGIFYTPIDNFVQSRLAAEGLRPSTQADKRTLIRRAYLDLNGLAPTLDEVRAFEADTRADAFGRVIEQLLASPHYGEHWGRHWLDVARYADTKGYVFQQERNFGFSHTYRDYVVEAFNNDLPYDTFLKHQLAADRMDLGEDKGPLAAMGYLTLGRRFVGNVHDVMDDRIDVVTRGMQGLTVSCARCHEHKYDPISPADYYGLYGIFRSSQEPGELPLIEAPDPEDPKYQEFQVELNKKLSEKETYIDEIQVALLTHVRDEITTYMAASNKAWDMEDKHLKVVAKEHNLKGELLKRWRNHLKKLSEAHHTVLSPWFAYRAIPAEEFGAKTAALAKEIAGKKLGGQRVNRQIARRFEGEAPKSLDEVTERYKNAFGEANKAWSDLLASHTQMTIRQPANPRPVPSALKDGNLEEVRQLLYGKESPANIPRGDIRGLSEVPIQNKMRERDNAIARVKSTHAGRPARAMALVDSPKPFAAYVFRRGKPGNRGDKVQRKYLEILTPADAPVDEKGSGRLEMANVIASHDNPLTARVMVNRVWMYHFGKPLVSTPSDFGVRSNPPTHPELLDYLASEFMASGWSVKHLHRLIMGSHTYQQDSLAHGEGASSDPENSLLWRQNRQRRSFESMRDGVLLAAGRLDRSLGGEGQSLMTKPFMTRRTLYGRIERQNLPALFRTFDFASPDAHTPMRINTTVPQQALFLMNSPFLAEQAKHLAIQEVVANKKTPEERIAAIYHTVFQREPAEDEIALGRDFVATHTANAPDRFAKPRWQCGYGNLNKEKGALESFTPLPHFTGTAWQGGPKMPDPDLNWVSLNARGGHPGPAGLSAVRRWTAPYDTTVSMVGDFKHGAKEGDGVLGYAILNAETELWQGHAHDGEAKSNFSNVLVKAGDTIDLVVDCGGNTSHDSFTWHPRIFVSELVADQAPAGGKREWLSRLGMTGPPPTPMEPWEKYAQVLLMSNEFMFVD